MASVTPLRLRVHAPTAADVIDMGGGPNLITRSIFSTGTPAADYSTWYTPGFGSPAVSTSDYYHMSGIWYSEPYDLDAMGSDGAAVKAANGNHRYVWLLWGDHPDSSGWIGSGNTADLLVGFGDDPQIWPDPGTMYVLLRRENVINGYVDMWGFTQNSVWPYHFPRLVYNPDSAGDKFWIYAEVRSTSSNRSHELGLITTPDFSVASGTFVGPILAPSQPTGWTSLGYVYRLGVNNWLAITFGKHDGSAGPLGELTPVYYKYTSTDGMLWTPDYSVVIAGPGPYVTISGHKYLLAKENGVSNAYVSLLEINPSTNVSLGTYTRISTAYADSGPTFTSRYPGPTYLQAVWGHEEDGIISIYASRGYFLEGFGTRLGDGPYLGNFPTFFTANHSGITSNVINITSLSGAGGTIPIQVGFKVLDIANTPDILSFGTGTGGIGTYVLETTNNIGPGSATICTNGGLWHEFIDLYYYITDATAAAGAAPLGVTADCTNGVVTISWNACPPGVTYRVYKGASAGTQATLVGDVTGTSITDTPTLNQQWWYKVVRLNSGIEQKNRVVHCYASNNTLMVTRHINRVIDDGGDVTKIDKTFLASVDAYLTSNDYYKYLMYWVDARFGIKLNGSGFVSKVYCLGTTRLPRGGDYTPTTSNTFPSTSSNTSYSATSFRGTTPSWVNNTSGAHGYFGNGRSNNIQRKNEITLIAAYQKPGTAVASLFGMSQFASALFFQHGSGASGNVSFVMPQSVTLGGTPVTATAPFVSATAAHVAAGVHDGSTMTVYLDGVAGTPVNSSAFNNPMMINDSPLRGAFRPGFGATNCPVFCSGTSSGIQTLSTRAYSMASEALFTCAALIVFEKGLSSSDITTIGAMYA